MDQHGSRVDLVEITFAVIIAIRPIEAVAAAQVIWKLIVGPHSAIAPRPTLPHVVQLLGLSGRKAAIIFLGKTRRATAIALADVAGRLRVALAWLGVSRSGRKERGGAREGQ